LIHHANNGGGPQEKYKKHKRYFVPPHTCSKAKEML
jgi:hypothetical protein